MKHDFLQSAENYAVADKRKKRRHKIVTFLAAIVVFCTTYALILPAITMENDCKIPEHTHTDDCYTLVTEYETVPVCSEETLAIHKHSESCYDENGAVVCGYADFVVHTHNESCFDEDGTLWCALPEIEAHTHNENCFAANEHEHTEDCYVLEQGVLICTDETAEHEHTDECYEWNTVLTCEENVFEAEPVCGKDEIILHTHELYVSAEQPGCYDEQGNLACGKAQIVEHEHGEQCFEEVEIPLDTENPTCGNADAEHIHTERCYGKWELTCGMEEHTHTAECTEYYCGKTAHTHSDDCYNADGSLACDIEEHEHDEECKRPALSDEDSARVENVINMIAELPTNEEIAEAMAAFEEGSDEEIEYLTDLTNKVRFVYSYYEDLGSELCEYVTNADKLLQLAWLYEAETLEIKDTLKIYQVNKYSAEAKTTLVYGGSVREKLGTGMSFLNWTAIVVEKNDVGKFYIDKLDATSVAKLDYKASTSDGFVILVYRTTTTVNVSVGAEVTIDFDYKNTSGYNANGHGNVVFGDALTKSDKDNSAKLTTVQGADTRDIIEVNLYDYGSNINDKYNSNKNYPGFQQDGGQKSVSYTSSSNFGNNITKDLAAGNSAVTDANGNPEKINQTDKTHGAANAPVSGAMYNKLINGYPALADGTSLGYLWGAEETYASKVNEQSINGLFLYNDTTGAYTFNSRENHAQYNSSTDTFTLYNQVISSNFMWYPFGNFLPFNDIVHESAQASTIDRTYLKTIANSAQTKGASGQGTEYTTLANTLNAWIGKMDEKYGTGWGATEATEEYFNGAGPFKDGNGFEISESTLSNVYSIDFDEATDFYFGMEMKMNFMQPRSGYTGKDNAQPMVFYFTGDDDVWVYIDDVLFLDLSGIHRHVGGEIDFVNGVVKYYYLDVTTGDVSTTPYKTVKFSEIDGIDQSLLNENGTFKDYSRHTFNFYYMERGAGSGVCRMNFNFPLLRKNSFSVTKELSADNDIDLLGNPDFLFRVLRGDNSGELYIKPNTEFTIMNSDGSDGGKGVVDANGIFKLKAGQTAVFDNIEENAGTYYIEELINKEIADQYDKVYVSGDATTKNDSGITVDNETFVGFKSPVKDIYSTTTAFTFTNKVDTTKLGSLSITKELEEYGKSARTAKTFSFYVTLDGNPLAVGTKYTVGEETKTVETAGIIELKAGETAVVPNILAGTKWTVEEQGAGDYYVAYKYGGTESDRPPSGTVPLSGAVSVIIVNKEKGASIEIPIEKTLNVPDGKTHTYKFNLEQVTDSSGMVSPDNGTKESIELKVTGESPVTGTFTVNYPQSGLGTLPATFYYKITEEQGYDTVTDSKTDYDTTVYVIEVTVSEADDGFTASVTGVWKDGNKCTENETPAFVNSIIRYELPSTGGSGTTMYTLVGFALVVTALVLLKHNRKKRGKEARNAS